VAPADEVYHRAIDVAAPAPAVFRWLCQLRVAPYSYDWLDNGGRRSPRSLTPGLERLEVGQRFMTIFALSAFEHDRQITLRLRRGGRLIGDLAVTYLVSGEAQSSRLLVRLVIAYPDSPIGWLGRLILPPGDLIMMRKQLRTLARLASRS
jgi:hypothetical protein